MPKIRAQKRNFTSVFQNLYVAEKYEHEEEPLVKFKKIRGNISDT